MYEMFGEETIAIIYNNLAIQHSCHPYVCNGLFAMGYGLWAMSYELWTMGYGLWGYAAMGHLVWAMWYRVLGIGYWVLCTN